MGCDIHMFTEVKDQEGKWKKVGKIFKNQYYDPKQKTITYEDGYVWNEEFTDHPYDGRNYDLFAILADVRNGRGFAGVKTGEGFVPIDNPRGLPDDISDLVKVKARYWGEDGHSHSYLTLKELQDYNWNQLTMLRGYVGFEGYKKMIAEGRKYPKSWCGGISGRGVVCIEENYADKLITEGMPDKLKNKSIYVNYHWMVTYKEAASYFVDHTMVNLAKLGSPENVRIVFWFDN